MGVTDGRNSRSPLQPTKTAELLLDFVNTRPVDGRPERLADAGTMAEWLVECGLAPEGTLTTEADAANARELRAALVVVMLAHAGGADGTDPSLDEAERLLRRAGTLHPLAPVVTAAGSSLVSSQTGVAGALGALLAAAADLARQDGWARLKACRNPPCHLGFYDRTRNSSATYCGPGCGSQVSMRAYRSRLKAT
ncbi:CGNR zinc finger domain-containing protein [Nocardiopsis sp. EMB25]|uniref:CGNR zinc finger domain-containing protein n=1 Tax=Nocardiopsis sp. EMB25 TaxID=2835867 RepID=UPI00228527FE|nr:CGNR zinc finger domain-containing protein [Nocardiopsis sp. EMB25]MCY9786650.1 CGNR zinc finger domain-containing protein [Nocardiopsis sp. EMB25]